MKQFLLVLISLVAFSPLFAQAQTPAPTQNPNSQEVVVRVVREDPKPAAPAQTVAQKANEWVDFGKNVGTAMDAGLSALTDHAEKFSKTDAGRFTMAIIAWKVAGRDAVELTNRAIKVVFGVPVLIGWNCLAIWFFRRMFLPRRVVIKKSGFLWWGTREYKIVNEDDSWREGKTGGAFITCVVWVGISMGLIFGVIL
jgi:hypothetical protein